MSLSLLNLNNGSAPEPSQDNTISLREYAGGPMAQADMEQNLVNFRGRINSLINGLSSANSSISSTSTSLQSEISTLETTLTNNLNTAIANQQSSTAEQLASLDDSVSAHVSPVGTVMAYAGSGAPTYWLLCNGGAISRSTYSELFSAIGTAYGSGDGSSTFNLPDLRGRVVAGVGASGTPLSSFSLGSTGGEENIVLTTSQIPSHDHVRYGENDDARASGGGAGYGGKRSNASVRNPQNVPFGKTFYTTPTGGGAGHSNIQPTMALNYIIHSGV